MKNTLYSWNNVTKRKYNLGVLNNDIVTFLDKVGFERKKKEYKSFKKNIADHLFESTDDENDPKEDANKEILGKDKEVENYKKKGTKKMFMV